MKKKTITVFDENGKRITGRLINRGTEGAIYKVNWSYAVKIYYTPDAARMGKIEALKKKITSLPRTDRRIIRKYIAIPDAIVKNESGKAVGFRMRRFSKTFQAHDGVFYKAGIPYYKKLSFARDFARVLEVLHRWSIYVGDFNPKNFLSNTEGAFKMVDADTLDFHYNSRHYQGIAFFPETLPNETLRKLIQYGKRYIYDSSIQIFDEASDMAAFAYTTFRLLHGGSPFAATPATPDERTRRIRGICPIFQYTKGYAIPPYIIQRKYSGKELNRLFERTFVKEDTVHAGEYYRVLKKRQRLYRLFPRRVKEYGKRGSANSGKG